ncbi:hypothetical protein SIN8267_01908 [Sinobacterium norvegicum]|uniref:Histidine kinase n=1 Tax=Sinobacterium norvegicum TaxID=1641715 RepID=A0ABN8EJF0_9GAMM|nr:TorF family putative porin [Sinobacterium norvegicum]CAH0991793.1 hypothetical protein SIN8267_01908 [Sinobacterium norvegicum]
MLKKSLLASSVAAVLSLGVMPAMAEEVAVVEIEEEAEGPNYVSATVGVSNLYLWRGLNLSDGKGSGSIYGSLDWSHDLGFYAGVWGASGDGSLGTEYDLYGGYTFETGDFFADIMFANYVYPEQDDEPFGDNTGSDVIVTLGFAGVEGSYTKRIAGGGYDDAYLTLGYSYAQFGATLGYQHFADYEGDGEDANYTHLDVNYAFNDNLTFTVSKVVDRNSDAGTLADVAPDATLFVVAYDMAFDL